MTTLVDRPVSDRLWAIVEPLLPPPPRPPYGGRRRTIPDRNCFAAIVYMARTSTPWRLRPDQELGCGSPATAWRRLAQWARAGVFERLHLDILDRLGEQGRLDWSLASVDSASVRAKRGDHVGANPVDRGKPESKIQLVCEGSGLPLTAAVTAANVPDVTLLQAMVGDIPPVRTPSGRRRCRPGKLDADNGYDSTSNRAWLRRRGIIARIARRGIESSTRLGRHRWRVERARSWLSCYRRLQVRWDRDSERWFALCAVGLHAGLLQPALARYGTVRNGSRRSWRRVQSSCNR